ncbi:MAG: ArdC family protein [Bryobacteraceae bacterium]
MNHENGKTLIDNAVEKLQAALEAGQSETLKAYLAAMARFRRYSWGNILLIASQCPSATRVCGFKAWQKFGRYVRKGEKGILILAPMVGKKRTSTDDGQNDEQATVLGFRAAYVWDQTQTDGEPLPQFADVKGDPAEYTERLKALIAERGIKLEYSDAIAPAKGVSMGGTIRVLPGLPPASEFSVLVHELSHEALHHQAERKRQNSKTVMETEAEAVAFVVCEAIGLDNNGSAVDYIALYHGDKAILTELLAAIQETAAGILEAILPGASEDAPGQC